MQAEKVTAIHNAKMGDINQAAGKAVRSQVQIFTGTIDSIEKQSSYIILAGDGKYTAIRSFSCFIEPMLSDSVLFSINEQSQCHILSVIERQTTTQTSLKFPGDVVLDVTQGQLNMHAQQGITLSTESDISLASEGYLLLAKKALFSVEDITATGSRLMAKISHVKTYADTLETVADNLLQKLKNSFRLIECVDQSKSHDTVHTVENLYSLRSSQSAILAKKDMKIDAERIHMG